MIPIHARIYCVPLSSIEFGQRGGGGGGGEEFSHMGVEQVEATIIAGGALALPPAGTAMSATIHTYS